LLWNDRRERFARPVSGTDSSRPCLGTTASARGPVLRGQNPGRDVRGGPRAVSGAGDDRVPAGGELRAARPGDERRDAGRGGAGPRRGRSGPAYIDRVLSLRAEVRQALADLVAVAPEQVALTASTTDGCNVVLAGLDLGPEDEVVTTTDEHFGLIGPLHVSSARVIVAPPDPDAIVAAVTPRTRLLALSHVLWTTGQVLPVHELRERTGIPILVDGAQSVGAIPVDAPGLDFLTISGQKWLCGPESTGALVVAEPAKLRVARPSYFAQKRYDPDGSFEPWPGARRFDPNWVPVAFMSGLLAALGCRPEWGFDRACATAERLRALLHEAGEDVVSPSERATLVSWRPAVEETAAVVQRLHDAGVVVRDLPGTGLVRASVGWWTSEDDLERLVAALAPPVGASE
jgi:L-cysteine/cystine lyase